MDCNLVKMQPLYVFNLILIGACCLAYGLECYTCDSAEDTECATKPGQQISVEECNDDNSVDECVTSISAAGLTRRGCLTHLFPNKYCAEPCDRCNTSLCNGHIFPTNRLRCYQCSGAECIDVTERPQLLLPCPVYNENDRCYTNIVHLSNTLRGCEHTNLPTDCPHVCLKCNYNGCNNVATVAEDRCLQCTHNRNTPNPLCLRDQAVSHVVDSQCMIHNGAGMTDCSNKVMLGHRANCFTYINEQTNVMQRGCSTSMGFYPTGELHECAGAYCNNRCIDIACNVCNATEALGGSCRSGVNLSPQICESGTIACFSCEQDTQLRRGCVDANFVAGAAEACQLCSSADGCNRWSARSCYRCNSLQNSDCADWLDESLIERANCTHAMELCISTVVSRLGLVYTVRGCSGEVPECTPNDPYCVRCNGTLCNNLATNWQQRRLQSLSSPDAAEHVVVANDSALRLLKLFLNIFN